MSQKQFKALTPDRQALILRVDSLCMRVGITPILRKNQREMRAMFPTGRFVPVSK